MGIYRPLNVAFTGSSPNRVMTITNNTFASPVVVLTISQANIINVTSSFIEASTDSSNVEGVDGITIPSPQIKPKYNGGNPDWAETYEVVDKTIVTLHMADGSEHKFELQDFESAYNGGTQADINNFITDLFT